MRTSRIQRMRGLSRWLQAMLLIALAAGRPAGAQVVDSGTSGPFYSVHIGGADIAVGQTLRVPGARPLASFTFAGVRANAVAGDTVPGTFHIAPWDGSQAGAPVFSAPVAIPTTLQPLSVATGVLPLAPGGQYLVYLESLNEISAAGTLSEPGDRYPNGEFVYRIGTTWSNAVGGAPGPVDAAFRAVFSDRRPKVDVNGIAPGATSIDNVADNTGTSIQDYVNDLAAAARNHGQYVSGISHLSQRLLRMRVITARQAAEMRTGAARSNIGKKR